MPEPTLSREQTQAVEQALAEHRARPGALLPVLHAIQDRLGFIPPACLSLIAETGNVYMPAFYAVLTAAGTLLAVLTIKDRSQEPLRDF